MAGKMSFIAGLAIGYVLGTKAGRERYEQLMRTAQKVRSNPSVQEAAGMVQSQTTRLMSTGSQAVRGKIGPRLGNSRLGQRLMGSDRGNVLVDEPPPSGAQPPSHF